MGRRRSRGFSSGGFDSEGTSAGWTTIWITGWSITGCRTRGISMASVTEVIDPVCGMTVVPGEARGGSFTWKGQEYHFCNPGCRERFAADPAKYLDEAEAEPAPPPVAPPGAK